MRTLEELGISPAPWSICDFAACAIGVCAFNGWRVAESRTTNDARLIAAAPELYEACRKLLAAIKNRMPSSPTLDELELIDLSEMALKKAGGAE